MKYASSNRLLGTKRVIAGTPFGHDTILAMKKLALGEAWLAGPRLQVLLILSLLAHHLGMLGDTTFAMEIFRFGITLSTRPHLLILLI